MITCPCCRHRFHPAALVALTRRQRDAVVFIRDYQTRNGFVPAYTEIMEGLGLKSKSGVNRVVGELEYRGALVRIPYRARALQLTEAGLAAVARVGAVAA